MPLLPISSMAKTMGGSNDLVNNLLLRLQRSEQAEYQLRRTDEGICRLAAAIGDAQAGRKPIWPAPTGAAADLILERIRGSKAVSGNPHSLEEKTAPDE